MPLLESSKSLLPSKGALVKVDGQSIENGDCGFTNICTGFGVDHEVPVRVAVYALPVLQVGEQMLAAQTEFYIAQAFATKINNLDSKKVAANVDLLKEYISLLRRELKVRNVPAWLEEGDPFKPERTAFLSEMVKILREKGSERIIRFADSRNGDESLAYIAAHALYMWDDLEVDTELFITQRLKAPESLLVVGGPAEKLFYEARQLLLSNFPNTGKRKTAQGFTEIGRRPPYYSVDGEFLINGKDRDDIGLEKITSIADPDALRDTLYLLISLTETLTFSDISRIKKGQIKPHELDDLTAACIKLQAIIAQLRS
jgi:hypothetical protein